MLVSSLQPEPFQKLHSNMQDHKGCEHLHRCARQLQGRWKLLVARAASHPPISSTAPAPLARPAAGSWMRTAPRYTLSQSWPPACRCSTAHGMWARSRHGYTNTVADTRSNPFRSNSPVLPCCKIMNACCLPLHTVSKLRYVGVPLHTETCFQHAVSVVSGAQMRFRYTSCIQAAVELLWGDRLLKGPLDMHACQRPADLCLNMWGTLKPA